MTDEDREMTYEEAWEQAKAEGFVDQMAENLKALAESAAVLSIAHDKIDVKFACEIGYAIWLDKPILVVNVQGGPLSEKMRKIADRIIDVDWTTQEGRDDAARLVGEAMIDMHAKGLI